MFQPGTSVHNFVHRQNSHDHQKKGFQSKDKRIYVLYNVYLLCVKEKRRKLQVNYHSKLCLSCE